jgi:hypothetical protein
MPAIIIASPPERAWRSTAEARPTVDCFVGEALLNIDAGT